MEMASNPPYIPAVPRSTVRLPPPPATIAPQPPPSSGLPPLLKIAPRPLVPMAPPEQLKATVPTFTAPEGPPGQPIVKRVRGPNKRKSEEQKDDKLRTKRLLACYSCRKSHQKCDHEKPSCGDCIERKIPCEYPKRSYDGSKRTAAANERRRKQQEERQRMEEEFRQKKIEETRKLLEADQLKRSSLRMLSGVAPLKPLAPAPGQMWNILPQPQVVGPPTPVTDTASPELVQSPTQRMEPTPPTSPDQSVVGFDELMAGMLQPIPKETTKNNDIPKDIQDDDLIFLALEFEAAPTHGELPVEDNAQNLMPSSQMATPPRDDLQVAYANATPENFQDSELSTGLFGFLAKTKDVPSTITLDWTAEDFEACREEFDRELLRMGELDALENGKSIEALSTGTSELSGLSAELEEELFGSSGDYDEETEPAAPAKIVDADSNGDRDGDEDLDALAAELEGEIFG